LWITGLLLALGLASYHALRHYSPALVAFVVEESLAQKAPEGADPAALRSRFRAWADSAPGDDARMELLLELSQHLEKVQRLNELELEQLLGKGTGSPSSHSIRN